jgi:ATP-dependent helicase/nuclease subunit B
MKNLQNDNNINIRQRYLWYKIIVAWFNKEVNQDFAINLDYCWQLSKSAFDAWNVLTKIPVKNINQNNNPSCFKIVAKDLIEECKIAAAWAKQQAKANNQVGIVILNLEKTSLEIDYIFSNFLDQSEYSIYMPIKLNTINFIDIALLILKLANNILTDQLINYTDFSNLLRTKFILGYDIELGDRAQLDYILRKKIDYEFTWQYIINNLQNCNIFIKLCNQFEHVILANNKNYLLNQNCLYLVNFSKNLLEAFGFEEKIEKNLKNNLDNLFNQYLALTDLIGLHDFADCIKILINLSKEIDFNNIEPKNINILDWQSALQVNLDNLWVCGLSDVNGLNFTKFNPFLPKQLQPNDMDSFLQTLIKNTNKLFIASYPLYLDGNKVSCNNLIIDFTEFNINFDKNLNNLNLINLELYEDNWAPYYNSNIFSGVKFLKLQEICPFKANAEIRLKAKKLNTPNNYLDPVTKGEIIHKALEIFWRKYPSSDLVKNLSIEIIYKKLLIIIKKILTKLQKLKPVTLNEHVFNIEALRIAKLCCNFIINLEFKRDFKILLVEKKFEVLLKEFLIKIKIDRIDQLLDNQLVIIDYKTGKSFTTDDPQLLVYSLSLDNIKELQLFMITNNPKIVNLYNWQDSKDIWYENLYKLAKDFQNGVAIVNPKYKEATCRTCDLKYMCRVYAIR